MTNEHENSTTRDLGDIVWERIEADEPRRLKLARLSTPRTKEQSVAVLLQRDSSRRDHLADRGISPEVLNQLGSLVSIIARTVENSDAEGAEQLAAFLPVALGIDGKHDKVTRIYDTINAWLTQLPRALQDPSTTWAKERMRISTRMNLAACGMPVSDEIEAQIVPLIMEKMQRTGYGKWGAMEATVQLMRACEYEDGASERDLGQLIKNARRKKTKNLAAKNS